MYPVCGWSWEPSECSECVEPSLDTLMLEEARLACRCCALCREKFDYYDWMVESCFFCR